MHQNTSFSKGFLDRFHMLSWAHFGQMDRIYLNPWAISGSSGMFGTPSPIMLQKEKKLLLKFFLQSQVFPRNVALEALPA